MVKNYVFFSQTLFESEKEKFKLYLPIHLEIHVCSKTLSHLELCIQSFIFIVNIILNEILSSPE